MKRLALSSLLFLAGCVMMPLSSMEQPDGKSCPIAQATKPIWPDSCVAEWYAKAKLPPCVEDYLQDVKTQQKRIAKRKING